MRLGKFGSSFSSSASSLFFFNMPFTDSCDKIITTYFHAVTRQSFKYKKKTYNPKLLIVSPYLFRGYCCPEGCGACCHHEYTLDYIPSEFKHQRMQTEDRKILFDGREVLVQSNLNQNANNGGYCRYLNRDNGRCGVHTGHPFSCDFELLRFVHHEDKAILTQKLFGRGWAMLRIDGTRGAECSKIGLTPIDKPNADDAYRKLQRLKEWVEYFGIKEHCLDQVIEWARTGPHVFGLKIPADKKEGTFIQELGFPEDLIQIEI